jgi:hypothetical protein
MSGPGTDTTGTEPVSESALALAAAVQAVALEAGVKPKKPIKRSFTTRQLITLLMLAVDLAVLAVLFGNVLNSEWAKFFRSLFPLMFGGAIIAKQEWLQEKLQALARHQATLITAVALLPLLLVYALPVPVPLNSPPDATTFQIAGDPPRMASRIEWLGGFSDHEVLVTQRNDTTTLPIGRLEMLAGPPLSLASLVTKGRTGFGMETFRQVSITKPQEHADLIVFVPRLPWLVRQRLHRGGLIDVTGKAISTDVQHGRKYYVVEMRMSETLTTQWPIPPGLIYMRLKVGDCERDYGWHRFKAGVIEEVDFTDIQCRKSN